MTPQADLAPRIQQMAQQLWPEAVAMRRHLHAHPELSFAEHQTSAYVQSRLQQWGIPFQTGFVQTGILGMLEGRNPDSRTIALRADMDALPIIEQNEAAYCSQHKGVMHACGHDVHTASLLATARILQQLRQEWEGRILLVFQPGEEKLPGGARLMMEQGVFDTYPPELIIGQHVMPDYEVGTFGFRPGMYMASADELYLKVHGQGGHGALPHVLTDTVLAASHIVVALQQVVSRNAQAGIPTVLTIGKMLAQGATNIVPNEVTLEGTLRTMNEEWRSRAHQRIAQIATSVAQSYGAECVVDIHKGYPFLVNHPEATQQLRTYAAQLVGEPHIIDMDIRMTGEDFAYYSQRYPSVFYRMGVRPKGGPKLGPLHSPTFDIDETALAHSPAMMSWLALSALQSPQRFILSN